MKLLIVEGDPELMSGLLDFSLKEKYQADLANTYSQAMEQIIRHDYDCIILDINLPEGNGLHLLEYLKSIQKNNGVIITSARNSLDDKITGLNLGAEDYLTKPFHLSELNARIQAIIRRKKFDAPHKLTFSNVVVDLHLRTVTIGGASISLTKKEFNILQHLMANRNHIVSKNSLAEYIWGEQVDGVDSFDFLFAHLKNLKKKLKQSNAAFELKNIYGVGYQLSEL